jgi:type IX secretion system PorP/SprF family membrane protein
MRKILIIFTLFAVSTGQLVGQQLPSWSSYYENGFVWNPALTAKWNNAETSVTHRQDWIGYDGAPQYSNISFQMPFISGYHTKSAFGVFVERDKVGPQEKYGAAVTYNYRFRPQWFGKRDDVLGLGMMINLAQYRFDLSNAVIYDPNSLNINTQDISGVLHPNVGMGAFYISVSDFYAYQKSHYYAGLSINQLIPSPIATFRGRGDNVALLDIQSSLHATLHTGYRYIPFRKRYFYEPSLMIIYGGGRAIHAMAHARYEMMHAFWLAAGGASTGECFAQAGVILDKDSFMKKIVKDGSLRIGLKSSWNLGSIGQLALPGLEFYSAYIFGLE